MPGASKRERCIAFQQLIARARPAQNYRGQRMQSSYLIENRHMAVKRCKHGLFMYNRNDAFIGRGLDVYGDWCEFEIQLLGCSSSREYGDRRRRQYRHPCGGVREPGRRRRRRARLRTAAPEFPDACGNVALNALDNVVCHQKAVGDAMGEIRLPPLPSPDTHFNFGAVPLSQGSETGESVPSSRSTRSICRHAA